MFRENQWDKGKMMLEYDYFVKFDALEDQVYNSKQKLMLLIENYIAECKSMVELDCIRSLINHSEGLGIWSSAEVKRFLSIVVGQAIHIQDESEE